MDNEYTPSDEIIEILENNGFSVHCNDNIITIQQYTELGEDWFLEFSDITSDEEFIKEILHTYDSFDVDEEVAPFIEMRGTHGVPDSISDLVDDAKWKEKVLDEVSTELNNLRISKTR